MAKGSPFLHPPPSPLPHSPPSPWRQVNPLPLLAPKSRLPRATAGGRVGAIWPWCWDWGAVLGVGIGARGSYGESCVPRQAFWASGSSSVKRCLHLLRLVHPPRQLRSRVGKPPCDSVALHERGRAPGVHSEPLLACFWAGNTCFQPHPVGGSAAPSPGVSMVPRFLGERCGSVFRAGLETSRSRIEARCGMPGFGTAARPLHLRAPGRASWAWRPQGGHWARPVRSPRVQAKGARTEEDKGSRHTPSPPRPPSVHPQSCTA